jgi:neutral trehalase
MDYLAKICRVLGLDARSAIWQGRAQKTSRAVHALLWDKQVQFYTDGDMGGHLTHVRAVSSFLPLLLADIPAEHAAALVGALADPGAFGSAFPIPSLSLDHPQWSTDMWRGATWINFNYLVCQALRERGYRREARRLAEITLAVVRREYERFGVVFEFFDAAGCLAPPECERKGATRPPYDIRRKFDSIRDYHWSAALCLSLLLQRDRGAVYFSA